MSYDYIWIQMDYNIPSFGIHDVFLFDISSDDVSIGCGNISSIEADVLSMFKSGTKWMPLFGVELVGFGIELKESRSFTWTLP